MAYGEWNGHVNYEGRIMLLHVSGIARMQSALLSYLCSVRFQI